MEYPFAKETEDWQQNSNLGCAGSGGDGADPQVAGSAGVPTADPDAMMEVEDLRTKQAWADFMGVVRDAIAGEPRHALAQHITQACQPKQQPGVAGVSGSLKASDADVPHEVHGVHECRIALKNLLELGDGIALNYVSEGLQSKKQAQKAAFVEVLSYILFRSPY